MKYGQEVRSEALRLRSEGWSVNDLAERLGIAKSTAYLWVRHLERMREARWVPHRAAREAARSAETRSAQDWVGGLSSREVRLLGAVAYWCEGAKEKPWRPNTAYLQFINSDERLILLFLAFLEGEGWDRRELTYRLSIHESADVDTAGKSWAAVVGVPAASFRRPTLKRHNPRTVRRNTEGAYRGCLIIYVPRSSEIYWRIEGVMSGIARAMEVAD